MKKILFLHGFGSSGATQTAEYLRKKLPEVEVISPDIPLHPHKAMRFLNKLCYDLHPDVIIGTSMGAMFAQQMHGFRKILVNPAFHVSQIMLNDQGVKKFTHPREDGETEYNVTVGLSHKYQEIEDGQFGGITKFDVEHTHAFFGTEDTLVDGYDEYLQYYTHATKFPGGHALLQKWVKAYVLPCAQQLLTEETDEKELDARRMYQLLADIRCGGGRGRAALLNLENDLISIVENVATNYYHTLYEVRDEATEGFQKVTREFVFDIDEMAYRNYTKFLFEGLHSYFHDEVNDRQFQIIAHAGKKMDSLEALELLARMYANACGASLGDRTIAYDAADAWIRRYCEEHPEDTRWEKTDRLNKVLPFLIDDYESRRIEDYDISYWETVSEIEYVKEMLEMLDPETLKALCWGLRSMYEDEKERFFFMLEKVVIDDDHRLDTTERAIYFDQTSAESAMLDWTLNNRDHLLCYIIRVVPRGDVFNEEMVKAVSSPDSFIDDLRFKEFVYMSTGFQRKHHFNVGDEVQYIFYDGKNATLRKSSIAQLPSESTLGILMSEGYIVPERYVFPL